MLALTQQLVWYLLQVLSGLAAIMGVWAIMRVWLSPMRKFLDLFHRMEKYKKRAREDAWEKRLLGRYVAKLVLRYANGGPLRLFIESGTTAAEVGLALLRDEKWHNHSMVYTNNILVGLAFAGKEKGAQCFLLPGEPDKNYPGVIGEATVKELRRILPECNLALLNTTGFDLQRGPCANSEQNRDIKKVVLETTDVIVICFASRKLLEPDRADAFLSRDAWHAALRGREIHIVTCTPAFYRRKERAVFEDRIRVLRQDLEEGGFSVQPEHHKPEHHEPEHHSRIRHLHLPVSGQPSSEPRRPDLNR